MCAVCESVGRDWKFHNGEKELETAKLYRIYIGQVAKIKLFRLHAVELFQVGENRFLASHLAFARSMAGRQTSFFD